MLGENYNLTCAVMGADKLSPMIRYEWIQKEDLLEMVVNEYNDVLSFSHFRLSHAGNYNCSVTITSHYVKDMITMTSNIETLLIKSRLCVQFYTT